MWITILGFSGMMYAFIDSNGEIGSKIPIVLFFLVITIIGMVLEIYPPDVNNTYGEFRNPRDFS